MLRIKKIKPMFNGILTTGEKYAEDMTSNGIIVASKGDLKLYQTVLEVGSVVKDIKVGDKVMIDPTPYAVMKYDKNSLQNDMDNNKRIKWNLPWVSVDDENGNPQDCLLLADRDVRFVFEGEEVKESKVLIPDTKIITIS